MGENEKSGFATRVMELFENITHYGPPEKYDGYAHDTGMCGDSMGFWVRIEEGRIKEARFNVDGCMHSTVAAEMAARLAEGRTTNSKPPVKPLEIMEALGGMPEDEAHCAILAANTLDAACRDAVRKTSAWRKNGETSRSVKT